MLLNSSSYVRTMRSWLTYKIVEGLVWPLPSWCLYTQESGKGKSWGKSKHHSMSNILDNWSHQWEGKKPSSKSMCYKLSRKLLHLPTVKSLHLYDLVICEIVIIKIGKEVPILSNGNFACRLVPLVHILEPGGWLTIKLLLHQLNHLRLAIFRFKTLLKYTHYYF